MKRPKLLRSTTIIPDDLYIDRDADRQLEDVVNDMGRPAYILVARQMGKTNLLLRMKRQRERLGDRVLYIDLSTSFVTATDLFRHIIDSLDDLVGNNDAHIRIRQERSGHLFTDGNVEYEKHLRLLLDADTAERCVIILDEIDSLVGHSYSDRILAQIRSMYFARANHSVYDKLTYVLSGVAEPTDLIKDKNISPFNIGEKIYLNDFTVEEVRSLVEKAKLAIPDSVVDRVFYWSSGNPRMTYDILSKIEDTDPGELIDRPYLVDDVVEKLYLTRFDRAPIDHIRSLAENDKQVREATIALLYGKGSSLDDRSRSKLYLAGITTASANEAPRLKNRIIELALSEHWLTQVGADKQSLLDQALRRLDADAYNEGLALFDRYFEAGGSEAELSDIQLMQVGEAHYNLGDSVRAENVYEEALKRSRSAELRGILRFHVASAKLLNGKYEEALALYEQVASAPGGYQLRAEQQILSAWSGLALKDRAEEVVKRSPDFLHRLQNDVDISPKDKAEVSTAAWYSLYRAYRLLGSDTEARRALETACACVSDDMRPGSSFVLLHDFLPEATRRAELSKIVADICDTKPQYGTSPSSFSFKPDDVASIISVAIELDEQDAFDRIIGFACERHEKTLSETLVYFATFAPTPIRSGSRNTLANHLLTHRSLLDSLSGSDKVALARRILDDASTLEMGQAYSFYKKVALGSDLTIPLTAEDFSRVLRLISYLSEYQRFDEISEVISAVRSRPHFVALASKPLQAVFIFNEMRHHVWLVDRKKAHEKARELISVLVPASLRGDEAARAYMEIIDDMRERARDVLKMNIAFTPEPKRRNDIVTVIDAKTGITSKMKYKKAQIRIQRGELRIVD